jgi:uncharacterized protein (TIGR02301 family)
MRLRGTVLSLALTLSPALADAAPPPPAAPSPQQRQKIVDLAYVLGEAHALHRVCAGPEDNTWRGRMSRLLQIEAPDPTYRQRLMDSFNAGFVARQAEYPTCTVKTADAERAVAARGRDLSRHLAAGVSP